MTRLSMATPKDDYYAVLGLTPNATVDEIRLSYRELAMIYHPDRVRRNPEINPESAAIKWQRLTDASSILLDEVKKRLYDIKMGFKVLTEDEKINITLARKEQALIQTQNMLETVLSVRAHQNSINGTIIVRAKYGCLEAPGYYIDVTIPVQNLVDVNSRIICKSSTKEVLEGFWDPTYMKYDKHLRVDYIFQNMLHSVVVEDEEDLVIPQPSHAVSDEALEELRLEREREIELKEKKKRFRKIVFNTSLIVAGTTLWWLCGLWPFSSKSTSSSTPALKTQQQKVKVDQFGRVKGQTTYINPFMYTPGRI